MRRSTIMLINTADSVSITGEPIRADGYWGYTDGIHSVSVRYTNFTGGFKLQGTLAVEPTDDDWFDIPVTGVDPLDNILKFPEDPLEPTDITGDSGIKYFNVTGNFVWLRAIMTREYMDPVPVTPAGLGAIDKVLLGI